MKSFLGGFKEGMKDFGYNISIIVNSVLLSAVYIIGVGITSIIAKLSGKHFLDMKLGKKTYWEDSDLKGGPKKYYYRQF